MSFRDKYTELLAQTRGWGNFIPNPEDLPDGADPGQLLEWSHEKRQNHKTDTQSETWNEIACRINSYPFATSDQCSEKHYQDVFEFIRINSLVIDRVFECGVWHGGLSVFLAGCAAIFDFQLDLIDVNPAALHTTYHRIRLTFPEAISRTRLFLGEVPNYVKVSTVDPTFKNAILHHDGSHRFNVVVNDLASLYFVRDRVHAILIQDTHLRSSDPKDFCFVDAAVAAVFGIDPLYQPIGTKFPITTFPEGFVRDKSHNIYFLEGRPEGMMIPLSENRFQYPHNIHIIDDFINFPER